MVRLQTLAVIVALVGVPLFAADEQPLDPAALNPSARCNPSSTAIPAMKGSQGLRDRTATAIAASTAKESWNPGVASRWGSTASRSNRAAPIAPHLGAGLPLALDNAAAVRIRAARHAASGKPMKPT